MGVEEYGDPSVIVVDDIQVEKPPKYHVVIHNDDYTPINFVIEVLQQLFGHSYTQAADIAQTVHEKGKGIAGTYTYDIAETKAAQVGYNAQNHGHPLLANIEEAE